MKKFGAAAEYRGVPKPPPVVDGAGRGMRTLQNVRIFATVGDTCILGARIPWHEVEG
jgi:hypothetical protein